MLDALRLCNSLLVAFPLEKLLCEHAQHFGTHILPDFQRIMYPPDSALKTDSSRSVKSAHFSDTRR